MPLEKLAIAIIGAFVALLLAGCAPDGYAELGLVEAAGVVTLDGTPLLGAKVSFESQDKRVAIGMTDEAGKYVLMYDSETPGVTPGPKTVRITTADVDLEGGGAGEGAAPVQERVPARYNQQSELKADVSASNRTFNWELKSAP